MAGSRTNRFIGGGRRVDPLVQKQVFDHPSVAFGCAPPDGKVVLVACVPLGGQEIFEDVIQAFLFCPFQSRLLMLVILDVIKQQSEAFSVGEAGRVGNKIVRRRKSSLPLEGLDDLLFLCGICIHRRIRGFLALVSALSLSKATKQKKVGNENTWHKSTKINIVFNRPASYVQTSSLGSINNEYLEAGV
jgi:hypothetical protein